MKGNFEKEKSSSCQVEEHLIKAREKSLAPPPPLIGGLSTTLMGNNRLAFIICLLPLLIWGCNLSFSGNGSDFDYMKQLNQKYSEWVQEQVDHGEYCFEKKCMDEMSAFHSGKERNFSMTCSLGLPDSVDFIIGDLNADGREDGIAQVPVIQCDGGNAMMFAKAYLVFLTQEESGYLILEDASILHSQGVGYIEGIENGIIVGKGKEHHEEDPRCCPSIEWETKFRVNSENEIVQLNSSKRRRVID